MAHRRGPVGGRRLIWGLPHYDCPYCCYPEGDGYLLCSWPYWIRSGEIRRKKNVVNAENLIGGWS